MEPGDVSKVEHLCVLVHGFWGKPLHLQQLKETLEKAYPDGRLYVFAPNSNSEYNTYDGVEVGGERITNEIEEKIAELESAGATLSKISVAGYSMGGVFARYAIGLLHKHGVLEKLEPINFTTFATPHLGVRSPTTGFGGQFWNTMGAKTLSASGMQMFLADSFRDTGKPLFSILAEPNSIFIQGLQRFKHKTVYGNTINDRTVPFFTSCISRVDPFVDLDAIDLNYLAGQKDGEEVILDPVQPATLKKDPQTALTLYERSSRTLTNVPFYALLTVLLPVGATFFLVNAGIQSYRSSARMRLHEEGKAGFSPTRYRIPVLEQAQAMQDRAVERITSEQEEQYLPTPPPEPVTSAASSSSDLTNEKATAKKEAKKEDSDFPILALTEEQFAMIDSLDATGLVKYPVHIHKVRHTHAAIVVRSNRESFAEGRVVSAHWVREFEL
jgi:hypothetical protein